MRMLVMLGLLLPTVASAQVVTPAVCAPSPRVATVGYPGARAIPTSNDLTRFNGKAVSAEGQRLLVQFRIRDTRCVPIQGAIVELWQANPFGNMRVIGGSERANPNAVFSGAGRSYTDNNGGVQFVTLFPAAMKGQAPRIQVRVKAPNMDPYDTIFYFENDVRNASDAAYKRLSADARRRVELKMEPQANDPNAGFIGAAEIILPGKARYRSY